MKWIRLHDATRGKPYGAMTGGLLAVAAAGAALWFRLGLPRPPCQFRELSGVPCMTCGATRMTEALISFDIPLAARLNPLLFLFTAGAGIWALLSLIALIPGIPTWRLEFEPGDRRMLWILFGSLALVNWAYLIFR